MAPYPPIACCLPLADDCTLNPYMQACDERSIEGLLPFTPNINVFRSERLHVGSKLPCLLRCAPLLCVEVQTLWLSESSNSALQALRSIPQSIAWQPLKLIIIGMQEQSSVLEVCAALIGTPLAQAASKIMLGFCEVEPPMAALRASFPNVLHFELSGCPSSMASSFSEAIPAWPMLRSISITACPSALLAPQQHLEAAARTAAELKEGQPFEIVLRIRDFALREGDAGLQDAQVAAVLGAGGGKVPVRWETLFPSTS